MQTDDEGYILLALNEPTDTITQLVKTNNYGEIEWEQNYVIFGKKVEQTSDGGYILYGEKYDELGLSICLIKTNEWGNITSTIELPTSNRKLVTTIDILGRETTNKGFQLHIYDDGSVEKKYIVK